VAKSVGRTSRKTCGDCHFNGGGGEAVKHADMSRQLLDPERSCDIHMGGYDFQCSECHRTRNHKIAGRSTSVPVTEGGFSCEDCHGKQPHSCDSLLDPHLNKHSETIACNTCHSPVYAKCKPTVVSWDWSKAGDKNRKPQKDKYGMDDYKGTVYEVGSDGIFNGIIRPMWDAENKRTAVNEMAQKHNIDLSESYAYGDTTGDFSMLKMVGRPFAINPTKELIARILQDQLLKDKISVIVERKDVTYKIGIDTLNLVD